MNITFYVSGHGFGHATRVAAVMESLVQQYPATQVYVRSLAPKPIFVSAARGKVLYEPVGLDVGVVEKDVFSQDIGATLRRWEEILARGPSLISQEVGFMADHGIEVIVSDIPPLASDIGAAAGIPTIAISNFSWDFIYEPFASRYPAFHEIIQQLRTSYETTSLLLRLPLNHEMSAFPKQQDIPFVVRKTTKDHDELRSLLGISKTEAGRRIILIALRLDAHVASSAIETLCQNDDFKILLVGDIGPKSDCEVHTVSPELTWSGFPGVVAMSDLVIGKLGYGLVAECIAGRTPLLTMPRRDFAEYDLLLNGCKGLLPIRVMPESDFLTGRWREHVESFLAHVPSWPEIPMSGAEAAVEAIASHASP